MSDIAPIGPSSAAALGAPSRVARAEPSIAGATRGNDQVEVSATARLLSKLAELPDVRQDVVDRVRKELAEGSYETPEKIDAAIENLAEDLL